MIDLFFEEISFSNRETAAFIWISIFLVACLFHKEIRASFLRIPQVMMNKYLLLTLVLMIVYVGSIVFALSKYGFWESYLLKDTVFWFFTAQILFVQNLTSVERENHIWKRLLKDNLKLFLIVEFFLNFFTFSLFAELLLLPTITTIGLLSLVAARDPKTRIVAKVMDWVMAIVGFYVLWYCIDKVAGNTDELLSLKSAKQLLLPVVLTFSFVPFIYFASIYSCYETLFIRLDRAFKNNENLRRYAKKRILLRCSIQLDLLLQVSRQISPLVWSMQNEEDVDTYFSSRETK